MLTEINMFIFIIVMRMCITSFPLLEDLTLVTMIQTNLPPQGLANDRKYATQTDWVTKSNFLSHYPYIHHAAIFFAYDQVGSALKHRIWDNIASFFT